MQRKQVSKGRLGEVEFQYNPAELNDSWGVDWGELRGAGGSYPVNVYSGGKQRVMTFTMYLDGVEKPGSVMQMIRNLNSYVPPAKKGGEYQFKSPPIIPLVFGWFVKDCLLDSVNVRYTAFTPDLLTPLRAEVQVTLKIIQ